MNRIDDNVVRVDAPYFLYDFRSSNIRRAPVELRVNNLDVGPEGLELAVGRDDCDLPFVGDVVKESLNELCLSAPARSNYEDVLFFENCLPENFQLFGPCGTVPDEVFGGVKM